MTLRKPYFHVNKHIIAFNRRHNCHLPFFTVKDADGSTWYAYQVISTGPLIGVDLSDKKLSCGAVAVVQSYTDIKPAEGHRKYSWTDVRALMAIKLQKELIGGAILAPEYEAALFRGIDEANYEEVEI